MTESPLNLGEHRQTQRRWQNVTPHRPGCHEPTTSKGFTLIELLVVISIIALLIGILLPSLSAARETARQIQCASQMRQLALSAEVYANDHDGLYPPRGGASLPQDGQFTPHWPQTLHRNYQTVKMLACPSDDPDFRYPDNPPSDPEEDPDVAKRSYLINGWNDVYGNDNGGGVAKPSRDESWSMNRSRIRKTSQVILFGEKKTDVRDWYMDLEEGSTGNQLERVEPTRHGGSSSTSAGGSSNYAFVDGSTRAVRYPDALIPTNKWAVVGSVRESGAPSATD